METYPAQVSDAAIEAPERLKKLLKLRDWLTLDEAAESLTLLFGEEISAADLVRLALDGQLTLSVRFVNNAYARGGPLVAKDEARQIELDFEGQLISIHPGVQVGDAWVIDLESEVRTLTGVWDLPMIGGERHDAEHLYQIMTFGPPVELICPDGPFVAGHGFYWQIVEHFSNNPHSDGSNIVEPWGDPQNFYPASSLPSHAVFVIRPDSFRELIVRVLEADQEASPLALPAVAAEPDCGAEADAPHTPRRSGGRRLSPLWPGWVAELVAHIHESGIPEGEGNAGQEALITAIEERLAEGGHEGPSRTTVQDTVRAVLQRLRGAGN